jgi:hypothetical protein
MIHYGKTTSSTYPQEVEITSSAVFIASDITSYEQEIDDKIYSGYEYDYKQYDKDEYITLIANENAATIAALQEELQATKILLGVE